MSSRALVVLVLAGFAQACSVDGADPKADPTHPPEIGASDFAWNGVAMRSHRDGPSALRFPMPVTGYRVTATHFDETSPPIKMKHELSIAEGRREVVRIEVWIDSEHLGLDAWFDKYLRFMATSNAVVETSRAGRANVDAIVVRQPRSEQTTPRRSVVFELDRRVIRATSIDDSDPTSAKILDRVVADLELGATP